MRAEKGRLWVTIFFLVFFSALQLSALPAGAEDNRRRIQLYVPSCA